MSAADYEFKIKVVDEHGNERSGTPMSDGRIEPRNEINHSISQLQSYPPTGAGELVSLHVQTADLATFTPQDSPFLGSAHSDSSLLAERSAFPVRRYSETQHSQATTYRHRSTSQPGYPIQHLPYAFSRHPQVQYGSNTSPSSTTTFSYPSPSDAGPSKLLASPEQQLFNNDPLQLDIISAWDASGQYDAVQAHIVRIDNMPDQPSPILGGLSPASDTSGQELQPSPTLRGRFTRRSSNINRHSPYAVARSLSRSPARIVTEMSNMSLEHGGVKLEPHSPVSPHGQYLAPPINTRLDAMQLSLRSFEDVSAGPSHYSESVEASPHAGSTLLQGYGEYPPISNISPAELEAQSYSPVRSKVGSAAIEKAASLRRKKAGEYVCSYPGCTATFTAKHNLQHHINSHYGIRNHKCPCGRDFGTSHVLRRHQKKCSGKKK